MESKFKVGDKVVPVSKSVYSSLEGSCHWTDVKYTNKPYLYVCKPNCFDDKNHIRCSQVKDDYAGDYFLESDLIHYIQ